MSMTDQTLITLLILSGIAHILMAFGSMSVPKLLDWNRHLEASPTLLRQVFRTYAAYTKMTIIAIGLLSITGGHELVGQSFLAKSINLFIVIYWVIRLGVGFLYYDRTTLTGIAKISDRTINVLMTVFVIVHAMVFARSMEWM